MLEVILTSKARVNYSIGYIPSINKSLYEILFINYY
jgi:hypothetical protein